MPGQETCSESRYLKSFDCFTFLFIVLSVRSIEDAKSRHSVNLSGIGSDSFYLAVNVPTGVEEGLNLGIMGAACL